MTLPNKILSTLAALCVFCVAPLYAQVDLGVQFTTTFPFYAGSTLFPAGTYLVTQPDSSVGVLRIAGPNTTQSAFINFIPTQSLDPAVAGKAVFNQYGNRDFLHSLTVAGELFGEQFSPGKKERQAADTEHQQMTSRVVASRSSSGI
jgi:hypothetical protein